MRRPPVAGRCSPPHGAAAGCRSSGFDRRANLSNCILADLRSAGSHCENSGSSDGSGASARSDRVKSEVFRDRSASAGGDTRYFSRCLIFWCFWIKPKAQKKNFERRKIFRSILREASRPSIRRFLRGADLPPLSPKGGAKSVRQAKTSGNGRRLAPETLRGQARARVFAGASAARSSSRVFARRKLRCAPRNYKKECLHLSYALRATMIIWLRSVLAGRRSSGAMGAVFRVKLKPILSSVSAVRKEERFFLFGCRRW